MKLKKIVGLLALGTLIGGNGLFGQDSSGEFSQEALDTHKQYLQSSDIQTIASERIDEALTSYQSKLQSLQNAPGYPEAIRIYFNRLADFLEEKKVVLPSLRWIYDDVKGYWERFYNDSGLSEYLKKYSTTEASQRWKADNQVDTWDEILGKNFENTKLSILYDAKDAELNADKVRDMTIAVYRKIATGGIPTASEKKAINDVLVKAMSSARSYTYYYPGLVKDINTAKAEVAQRKATAGTQNNQVVTPGTQEQVGAQRTYLAIEQFNEIYKKHNNYLMTLNLKSKGYQESDLSSLEPKHNQLRIKASDALSKLSELRDFSKDASANAAFNQKVQDFLTLNNSYIELYNSFVKDMQSAEGRRGSFAAPTQESRTQSQQGSTRSQQNQEKKNRAQEAFDKIFKWL